MSHEASPTVIDASLFPRELLAALSEGRDVLTLRVAEHPKTRSTDAFGPPAPAFIDLTAKRNDVSLVIERDEESVAKVEVESRKLAWGKWGGTPFEKTALDVVAKTKSGRTFVVATLPPSDDAEATASRLATALIAFLGLGDEAPSPDETESASATQHLPRLTLSREGEHWVLRDKDVKGPARTARRFGMMAIVSVIPAATALVVLVREIAMPERNLGLVLGMLALVLVMSLSAVAFSAIARHAKAYTARTLPVAAFTDDRVVVSPWLSRDGRIDPRPEGRLGAAIRIAEVSAVGVVDAADGFSVRLETEHGPIDVVTLTERAEAEAAVGLVERCLASVASPQRKKTALMRAKSKRAQATVDRPRETE